MSRIDDIAYSYAAEYSALGLDYNQGSDAVRYGYEKALEDVREEVARLHGEYTDIAIDSHYGTVNANHVTNDFESLLTFIDNLTK